MVLLGDEQVVREHAGAPGRQQDGDPRADEEDHGGSEPEQDPAAAAGDRREVAGKVGVIFLEKN